MLPLNTQNLSSLPAGLPVPGYDREALRTGIVHFGVGGFHRAHEAMYLDRFQSAVKARAVAGVPTHHSPRPEQSPSDRLS